MSRHTQISVFTDNRPGTLARITRALADQRVDLLAIAAWGETDHGVVRMVVDQPLKALHVLGDHGMPATETRVLGVELPHRPGSLNELAQLLSRSKVNIDYCYGSDRHEAGILYLKVDDLKRAEQALKKLKRVPARRSLKPRRDA